MAFSASIAATPRSGNHPIGLYALFTTEMWERFSYYGMRALLVLYLTKAVGLTRPDALAIYAIYTGLVYLTPLIGGRLADQYLGQRKAVFIGGILMALGQFALTQQATLYLGLGLLIAGNGFFKPNISTMVGSLYPKGDVRRDSAYTIFYMGINLGAFFSPIVCGPLGEDHGWWPGFAAAGVGMALGVLTFSFTQRFLQGAGMPPNRAKAPSGHLLDTELDGAAEAKSTVRVSLGVRDWVEVFLISALTFALVYGAMEAWPYFHGAWSPSFLPATLQVVYKGAILVGILALFLYLTEPNQAAKAQAAHEPLTAHDWSCMLVIAIISVFAIVFWMGFEQAGGTLNLFADEKTNRVIFGKEVPASLFQAINPVFIVALAPLFAIFWTSLERGGIWLPSFAKQGLGLVLLGAGFGVMYLADEIEKPTPAFAAKLQAAAKAGEGPAGAIEVGGSATHETVRAALTKAHADFARDKEIPYKVLDETETALKGAAAKSPADGGVRTAFETVKAAFAEAKLSRVSPLWLTGVYLLFPPAELSLSPIGLSLINKLAPARLASLMMAAWFLSTAAANYLAGMMESLIAPYHLNLWAFLGLMAAVPGVLMLLLTPVLVKMSHGRV